MDEKKGHSMCTYSTCSEGHSGKRFTCASGLLGGGNCFKRALFAASRWLCSRSYEASLSIAAASILPFLPLPSLCDDDGSTTDALGCTAERWGMCCRSMIASGPVLPSGIDGDAGAAGKAFMCRIDCARRISFSSFTAVPLVDSAVAATRSLLCGH